MADALDELFGVGSQPIQAGNEPSYTRDRALDDVFGITQQQQASPGVVQQDRSTDLNLNQLFGVSETAGEATAANPIKRAYLGAQRQWEGFGLDLDWDKARTMKDPEARAKRIAELQEAQKSFETKWAKEGDLGYAGDVAGVVSGMVRGTKGGIDEALVGGGIALGVGQLGPQVGLPEELITVPVGLKTGLAFGTAKEWKSQGSGEIYRDLITSGIDHDRANWWADKAGLLYAGIEYSQMDKLIPGGKKLANGTIKQIVKQAVTNYGKNVISESAEEGLQRVVTDMAKDIATLKDKGLSNDQVRAEVANNTGKYFQGFVQDFEASIPAMMLLGSPGAIIDTKQAIKAQQSQQPAQPGAITEQPQAQQPTAEQVQQPAYTEEQQGAPQEAVIPQTPDQQLDALFTAPETNLTPGMEQPLETDEQRAARTQREYEVMEEQQNIMEQQLVAGQKAEQAQNEIDQYQGLIDPYQALKEYIRQPQTVNRQGRQIVRMSPGAIYIGGEKGDPLPGEYRDLQRAFGFHFTTDRTKGRAIDDVLNEFSGNNPEYAMDDNQFREGLRKIQQTSKPVVQKLNEFQTAERAANLAIERQDLDAVSIPDTEQQAMVIQDMRRDMDELLQLKQQSEQIVAEQEQIQREERMKLGDLLLRGATMGSHQVNNKQAMIQGAEYNIMQQRGKINNIMLELKKKQDMLEKITIDELPVINQPVSNVAPLGIVPQEFQDIEKMKAQLDKSLKRFGAKFDVEQPFREIGAPDTGLAIKNAPSRLAYGEEKAEDFAKDMTILRNKMPDRTDAEVVFLAEGSIEAKNEEEKAFVEEYRKYMDERFAELKKREILDVRFPDSYIAKLEQEIAEDNRMLKDMSAAENIPKERLAAVEAEIAKKESLISQLKKINYVPLGYAVRMSLQRQLEELDANGGSVTKLPFFMEKGKFASFREILGRKSVSAKALFEKGLLKAEDLDAIMQGSYYTRYVYDKLAEKDIIDAAVKDGLASKAKRGADWVTIPQMNYPFNKYYYNPVFGDYLRDMVKDFKSHDKGLLRKVVTFMKMHQFINPAFLLFNNIAQGVIHPQMFVNLPRNFKEAARMLKEKGEDYQEAMYWGLSSTPDRNPLANFEKQLKNIKKNHGQDINTKMLNYLQHMVEEKNIVFTGINDLYNLSWNISWQYFDKFLRLAMYNQYKSEGLTAKEAAQETAYAMGDYAGIPVQTRRNLNLIMFTPSFKIATIKYYGSMIKGVTNWIKASSQGKDATQLDKIRAQGAAMLFGLVFGKHLFMVKTGAETKEFSRKYAYPVELDNGQKKDFNMVFSTPFNIPMRYWYRLVQPSGTDSNYFARASKTLQYELNPFWRMLGNLSLNQQPDGLPIFDPNDTADDILTDTARYIAGQTYALVKPVTEQNTKADREMEEAMKNGQNELIWRLAELYSFQYISDQQPVEIARRLQRKVNDFQNRQRQGLINEDPRAEERFSKRKEKFLKDVANEKAKYQDAIKRYNDDSAGSLDLGFLDALLAPK